MTFKDFGLNKFRNTMQSPRCDCGCGGKGYLQVDTIEDALDFAGGFLMELDCNHSAVFIVNSKGYYAMVKDWDIDEDDPEAAWNAGMLNGAGQHIQAFRALKKDKYFTTTEDVQYPIKDFFSFIDQDYQLHGYGLMVETENGYEIIEE